MKSSADALNWVILLLCFLIILIVPNLILLLTFVTTIQDNPVPGWLIIYLQFSLFLGVPTLVFSIIILKRQRRQFTTVLNAIEDSNRKFVFDDKSQIDIKNFALVTDRMITNLKMSVSFLQDISRGNVQTHWAGLDESTIDANSQTIAGELTRIRDKMILDKEDKDRDRIKEIEIVEAQEKEQKFLKESLDTEKYLFGALMDNIPDYIYYKDRKSKLIRLSKYMARVINLPEEEIIGKSDYDFHNEVYAKQAYDDEQRIMQTRQPKVDYVECEIKKDGTEVWVSTTKMPLINSVGEVVGTFGISRDVSNVKILEHAMQERTTSLIKITEEERLARLDAVKMREEAERATLAKSTFLATMSHEIRTPMNGVIGMASLLKETNLDSEQVEYVEIIQSCGESLLSVINNILDFSKIESGKMELDIDDLDVRDCIEEVLDMFSKKAAEVKIDILYQLDHDVPSTILCDGSKLKQILVNLVGNAIKFTKQGEVCVSVHLNKSQHTNFELVFEIRDTGIGIPEDKLDRLFKAFSQVDSSTTRKYGGTGLGLVICDKLIGLMGGTINVTSVAGRGTTFLFTIQAERSKGSVHSYVHSNLEGLHGKKILVVDDNQTNRQLLLKQLTQWRFEVVLCSSASEAITVLSERDDFDLIITDMQMPDMDGVGFAKVVRETNFKLPIILLSSVGDEQRKLYEYLFANIINKPVKQKILSGAITAVLKRSDKKENLNTTINKKLTDEFARKYPLTILIAEDNPVNQTVIRRALKKLGYDAKIAENGIVVLNEIALASYDVILMDVQMPEMDGLETTRTIRKESKKQPIIIAMTANALAGDKEVCLQSGMDDYLSKPIIFEEMINILEKWGKIILKQKHESNG